MSAERDRVFDTLLARIGEFSGPGLTMVAIDGVDGAGKTRFADALAARLEADGQVAVRAGIDGFHNPAHRFVMLAARTRPRASIATPTISRRCELRCCFRLASACRSRTEIFDHRTDRPVAVNPLIVPLPAVLVFDGLFLQSAELRDEWDLSIFLDVPFAVSFRGWPNATDRTLIRSLLPIAATTTVSSSILPNAARKSRRTL